MAIWSICVATGYKDRNLSGVLEDVKRIFCNQTYEVLIHFDGFEPDHHQLDAASYFPPQVNVKLMSFPSNLGWIQGRNKLAQEATGDYLVFLDDDLEELSIDLLDVENIFREDNVPRIVALRGKLSATNDSKGKAPAGWDKGKAQMTNVIDLEGLSIIRKREFLDAGGFANPSFGINAHEGINLTFALAAMHGPRSCVYSTAISAKHPVRESLMTERNSAPSALTSNLKISATDFSYYFDDLPKFKYELKLQEKISAAVVMLAPTKLAGLGIAENLYDEAQRLNIEIHIIPERLDSLEEGHETENEASGRNGIVLHKLKIGESEAEALLRVIKHLESDYVIFRDTETWYFPYSLTCQIGLLSGNPETDLFINPLFVKGIAGEVDTLGSHFNSKNSLLVKIAQAPRAILAATTISRRSVLRVTHDEDQINSLEDWLFSLAVRATKVEFNYEPVGLMRSSLPLTSELGLRSRIKAALERELKADIDQNLMVEVAHTSAELTQYLAKGHLSAGDKKLEEHKVVTNLDIVNSLSWRITRPLRALDRAGVVSNMIRKVEKKFQGRMHSN